MSVKVLFIALVAVSVLSSAFAGRARDEPLMRPANDQKTRTRAGDPTAQVREDLISIKLDTEDEDEARRILIGLNMRLVSREGGLAYWYIATPLGSSKRNIMETFGSDAEKDDRVIYWENVFTHKKKAMWTATDPLFHAQWNHQYNPSSPNQTNVVSGTDMATARAWDLGYSGQGVHIQIVDDGLDGAHAEFNGRFSLADSYNYATGGQNPNIATESHGTSCGGIAAAAVNNSVCGAGIAYRATISGIRWLGTDSSATAASALTIRSTNIHVSSNSWGYDQNIGEFVTEPAATFDAMSTLAGRGILTVFAAGNEAEQQSMCSRQEVTASPHQIVVGAVNDRGVKSAYSSECANVFVSAPSGDSPYSDSRRNRIVSAATGGTCTSTFSGTSAATPHVAGLIALMKEAKPNLSFRDIQAILQQTADRVDSSDASWVQNAAGKWHSNKYGFGRVNAYNAVLTAKSWTSITQPVFYTPATTSSPLLRSPNLPIPDNTGAAATDSVTVSLRNGSIVEHVGLYLKTNHLSANQLRVTLTSPSGTRSLMSAPFATARRYLLAGTNDGKGNQLTGFASPYWSGTATSVTVANYDVLSDSCTTSDIPQPGGAGWSLAITSFNVDGRCSNAVQLIEAAADLGYTSVFFYGMSSFVDFEATQRTNRIPSFYVPAWQVGSGDVVRVTAFTSTTPHSTGTLEYFYMGSWKYYGEQPNGAWTISVNDTATGSIGNLQNWLIQFMYSAPPLPPTAAAVPTGATVSSSATLSAHFVLVFIALVAFVLF